MIEGPKICENLFFAVVCISTFTCTIRSDYNFAMGLLCYYLIKNPVPSKLRNTTRTVSKFPLIYSATLCERFDNCYGHLMVHDNVICLGRETRKESLKLGCIQQYPWLHNVVVLCQHCN